MSKVERGQFSSLMRRYLGMVGASQVLDELAPEISASLTLESERPEWAFLKGERLCAHAQQVPAQAASQGAVRIRNPAGSGVVGICDYCNLAVGGLSSNFFITYGAQAADLATVSGTANRDGRQTPIGGALIASFGYAALGGNAIDTSVVPANSGYPFFRGSAVVIVPGFALTAGAGTVNLDFFAAFHWLEKRLDPVEQSS